LAKEKAKLEQQ